MTKLIKVNGRTYTGETFPEVLNLNKFNLNELGIKIVSYVPNHEPNTPKAFKESAFRTWQEKLNKDNVYIILWQGKGRLTTVQTDYINMDAVGAITMPYKVLLKNLKEKALTRKIKIKGRDSLVSILRGQRKDHKDGLLSYLNNRVWKVKIVDPSGKTIFEQGDLTENESSETLTLKALLIEQGTLK